MTAAVVALAAVLVVVTAGALAQARLMLAMLDRAHAENLAAALEHREDRRRLLNAVLSGRAEAATFGRLERQADEAVADDVAEYLRGYDDPRDLRRNLGDVELIDPETGEHIMPVGSG